jgi:hypothetical protein
MIDADFRTPDVWKGSFQTLSVRNVAFLTRAEE